MRSAYLILAAVLLAAGMQAAAGQPAAVVYLKWSQPLNPRLVDENWQTGAADLDQALEDFPLEDLRRAVRFPLKSDPCALQNVLRLELAAEVDLPACIAALSSLPGTLYA